MSISIRQRFDKRVLRRPSGCWEWQGGMSNTGYGLTRFEGRSVGAHRAAWMMTYGAIPPKLDVCHKCDNRRCVRPSHLFVATHRENMLDSLAKRAARREAWFRQAAIERANGQ